MNENFVITAIGNDRPGLVEELSAVVVAHGASWLESSMTHVSGKFAGLVHVSVPAQGIASLQRALEDFQPLRLIVERATSNTGDPGQGKRGLHLSLMGHDRVGIVREVSQVLARHAINVETLNTHTSTAAMSGETMFHAEADLLTDASADLAALQSELEALSNELVVDIDLREIG